MSDSRLSILFDQLVRRTLDPGEQAELQTLIDDPANDLELQALIGRLVETPGEEIALPEAAARGILETILATPRPIAARPEVATDPRVEVGPISRRIVGWRLAAAVVGLVFAGVGTWRALHQGGKETPVAAVNTAQDVAPGGNRATLKLADGSTIVLDSVANGRITQQGNTAVVKLGSGQLAYNAAGSTTSELLYNTVTTPRGGEYRVQMPDGSRVWLNAASSIRFPTAFSSEQRVVQVSGEAFFQVVKDAKRPFIVRAGDSLEVQVLGTDFDLMAYRDEPEQRTTLIRGAVRVRQGATTLVLSPGDQVQAVHGSRLALFRGVDTSAAIAWVSGFFEFRNIDLRLILRQMARWYDVQIVYDVPFETIKPVRFGGRISRNLELHQLLKLLEQLGVHFRVDGTTIHVMP
jgi:transmembrane sensor